MAPDRKMAFGDTPLHHPGGPVDRVVHRGLDLLGIHPIHGPLPGGFVRFCDRGDALVKPGQCVCIFADDRCLPAVQA